MIYKPLCFVILFLFIRHSTIKELKRIKKHLLRAAWERVFNWHCHPSKDNGKSLYFTACVIFDFTFVCYNAELGGKELAVRYLLKRLFLSLYALKG